MSGAQSAPSVILLSGGFGTRLRGLNADVPKPMIPVEGKPFLHWLVEHCARQGFHDYVFSTHHMAAKIEEYPWKKSFPAARFSFVREQTPLGTGGAVLEVFQRHPELQEAWVLNGDTYVPDKLPPRIDARWDAVYGLLEPGKVFDATPNVRVEGDRVAHVVRSDEKMDIKSLGSLFFDAGVVFVRRTALQQATCKAPCSLNEVLAACMTQGRVGYFVVDGPCYDIGTPERHARFVDYVKRI